MAMMVVAWVASHSDFMCQADSSRRLALVSLLSTHRMPLLKFLASICFQHIQAPTKGGEVHATT
eukprot:3017313-Amphidinium_carterae.1